MQQNEILIVFIFVVVFILVRLRNAIKGVFDARCNESCKGLVVVSVSNGPFDLFIRRRSIASVAG